jgi:hypothetical protein
MNTKLLMSASAVTAAAVGIAASFLPQDILNTLGMDSTGLGPLFVQVVGALYLGFAMMNWTAKSVLIGGIYARPLALGNFMHFAVGALALTKGIAASPGLPILWIAGAIYSLFGILFGVVLFGRPLKTDNVAEK